VCSTIVIVVTSVLLSNVYITNSIIPDYTDARNPVESFIFVKKRIVHIPRTCIPLDKENACEIYDDNGDGVIDPVPVELPFSSTGSGSVIGHNGKLEESYVLTAYHICGDLRGPEFMSVLVEPEVEDREHPDWIAPHVLIIEVTGKFSVQDFNGKHYKAKIFRGDRKNDLCILKTEHMPNIRPIKVADGPASPNSKVYNIASPRGLSVPGAVLTFEGYMSGQRPSGFHMFTFPVGPGSSGSPVLNEYGEIVSIVSYGYPWSVSRVGWEANVGGGPGWEAINNLIKPHQIQ